MRGARSGVRGRERERKRAVMEEHRAGGKTGRKGDTGWVVKSWRKPEETEGRGEMVVARR